MACSEFVGTPQAEAYGESFSSEEVDEAAVWLRQNELMKAFDAWQERHIRPSILPAGRGLLFMTDVTIDEFLHTRALRGAVNDNRHYSNHVQGSVGAIQQGDYNSAVVTQTLENDHRQLVLAKIRELEDEPAVHNGRPRGGNHGHHRDTSRRRTPNQRTTQKQRP